MSLRVIVAMILLWTFMEGGNSKPAPIKLSSAKRLGEDDLQGSEQFLNSDESSESDDESFSYASNSIDIDKVDSTLEVKNNVNINEEMDDLANLIEDVNEEMDDSANLIEEVLDYEAIEMIEEMLEHEAVEQFRNNLAFEEYLKINGQNDGLKEMDPEKGFSEIIFGEEDSLLPNIAYYEIVSVLGGDIEMYEEMKTKVNFLENQMKRYQDLSNTNDFDNEKIEFLQAALENLNKETLVPFEENMKFVKEQIEEVGNMLDASTAGYIRELVMRAETFFKGAMEKLDVLEIAEKKIRKEAKMVNTDFNGIDVEEIIDELEEAIDEFVPNKKMIQSEKVSNRPIKNTNYNKWENFGDEMKINDFNVVEDLHNFEREHFQKNKIATTEHENYGVKDSFEDNVQNYNIKENLEKNLERRISPKFKHLFDSAKEQPNDERNLHHHELGSTYQPRGSILGLVWLAALAGLILVVVGFIGLLASRLRKNKTIAVNSFGEAAAAGDFNTSFLNENYDDNVKLCINDKLK